MRHLSFITFFAILSLVMFSSCDKVSGLFGKKKKAEAEAAAAAQQSRLDSIRVADSVRLAQDQARARELARHDSIRSTESAQVSSRYHIIVGSFHTPAYARSLADEFRNRGHNTQILQLRGSRFELVSAESFSDQRAALNRLRDYRAGIMPEAWIYVNE